MRDLVTETPYYRPEKPTVDIVRVAGRRRLTVGSARELDLRRAAAAAARGPTTVSPTPTGSASRGSRRPRSSRTGPAAAAGRGPSACRPAAHLLRRPSAERSPRVGPREHPPPRGRRPRVGRAADTTTTAPAGSRSRAGSSAPCSRSRSAARSSSSRTTSRPSRGSSCTATCATGWPRWRRSSTGMRIRRRSPSNGRIVFVVDGYTTSANYPYAERVALGGASVNYARASVRATVDAFSGQVRRCT